LYLVLVGILASSVRFRLLGAGAALIVVAAIGFAAVHSGPDPRDLYWVEMLQLFFAVCSIVGVRTAMLLNERDLHLALLQKKHKSAVRASRFKSQLLAHVSHEVRSPLSAIIGFSSMLESGSLSADRAPEFAAIIAHNGELLQRLHDDLLDLSRAEAGALTLQSQRVAVGDTLKQCIGAIRLDATLGGKDVLVDRVADDLALTADPVRLAQILNNLIANAFKYGDNSSPIRVSARAGRRVRPHRNRQQRSRHSQRRARGGVPALPPRGGRGPQRAGRGAGPFHRQTAGRSPGRADRFR
jgi:signal transduction histidine kinase